MIDSLPSLRDQHWQAFLAEQKNGASESGTPLNPVYVHGELQSVV